MPAQMLVVGLSLEDEARQVADWAAAEHPGGRARCWAAARRGSSAWPAPSRRAGTGSAAPI
ncbi:hypothetical protein [Massilia sp. Dwa41.01b]|uniref:hypothetical protein n=1 Tax=Massilia sp. Dwa41.01b TaxID=2709302 RepID=UPI001E5BF73E|nr:hypothetical protein [Massilia sp. Dwa41.01b]